MRFAALIFMALTATFVLAGKYQPIYTGHVAVPDGTAMTKIENAVRNALVTRGWSITKDGKGYFDATLFVRAHVAKVKVKFDASNIHIEYVDSQNLATAHKGEVWVHKNYNRWVRILEQQIQVEMF